MTGRDPNESHRAATPLELLFDLTFVVAFSQISSQAAHYLELGDVGTALGGFAFSTFAVTWAWINYSWLASRLRQRRHLLPHRDARRDGGRPDRGPRRAAGLPLARRGRAPRQQRDGGRLCRHARRDGGTVAARREARSRAPADRPRLRHQHLDRPGRLGRSSSSSTCRSAPRSASALLLIRSSSQDRSSPS